LSEINPKSLARIRTSGRVAPYQAIHDEETQAVADALSLLANVVMAWKARMQRVLRGLRAAPHRRHTARPDRTHRPTHLEGINLRGVFSFPIEQYAEQLPPSSVPRKRAKLGR